MYRVNEIYKSIQGEGVRVGTENVFVRFTGCNMRCRLEPGSKSPGGFDCDTEFESGRSLSSDEVIAAVREEDGDEPCEWVILTGGEPGLQLDEPLIVAFHQAGYRIAVETNGSICLPPFLDWITVSPKVAEHCIRQRIADEVKYVRGYGQDLPRTRVQATHHLISPTFNGMEIDARALAWCEQIIKGSKWKLSLQEHKLHHIR